MKKRIAIVGAGAVGGFMGGYMARAGFDVTLIDAWPEHVETIRKNGLKLTGMTAPENFTVRVPIMHVTEVQSFFKRPIDIAIMAVKSYDTVWATTMIAQYLAPAGYVVSAQNSINEERIAGVVGWGKTVGCIVGGNYGADLVAAGCVARNMSRDLKLHSLQVGEVHGRITPRVEELVEMFKVVDGVEATTNLWGVRWTKLCVNGMRNAASASTGMSGNERDRHDIVRRVIIKLGGESVRVGLALGYDLEPISKIDPKLLLAASEGEAASLAKVEEIILEGTASGVRNDAQRPSMAQDMQKGRRTEIDFLNGMIADKAVEAGLTAPTHRAITEIVKQVERGERAAKPKNLFHLGEIAGAKPSRAAE